MILFCHNLFCNIYTVIYTCYTESLDFFLIQLYLTAGTSLLCWISVLCALHKVVIFQCFVGNMLGPVPLPMQLDESEYTHIHNEAFEAGKGTITCNYSLRSSPKCNIDWCIKAMTGEMYLDNVQAGNE